MNKAKFIRWWGKNREKGRKKYLLTNGIIMGVCMFIFSIAFRAIGIMFLHQYETDNIYLYVLYLFGGFVAGLIIANIGWDWNEEKYNKLTNNTD